MAARIKVLILAVLFSLSLLSPVVAQTTRDSYWYNGTHIADEQGIYFFSKPEARNYEACRDTPQPSNKCLNIIRRYEFGRPSSRINLGKQFKNIGSGIWVTGETIIAGIVGPIVVFISPVFVAQDLFQLIFGLILSTIVAAFLFLFCVVHLIWTLFVLVCDISIFIIIIILLPISLITTWLSW